MTIKLRFAQRDSIIARVSPRLGASVAAGDGITVTFGGNVYTVSVNAGAGIFQPLDSDLTALANNSTNGLWARTASGAGSARTITGPAAGVAVSNGDGVSGNPTLALANDLAAIEALSSAGMAARTAADTWAVRTLAGTAAEITVTNGDGVSGAPTFSLPTALTFTGKTITGGTFSSPILTSPNVSNFTRGKIYSDNSGNLKSTISNFVHPTEYGTAGSEAALVAALASGKHVDGGGEAYTITSTLTLSTNQRLINCSMIKGANVDLLNMSASGCELHHCIISGQGATFTGRGIYISSGSVQKITHVVMNDMSGYCLEFTAADAGDSIEVTSCEFTRTTASNYAVKFATDSGSAGRRWFNNVRGRGANLYDLTGSCYTVIRGGDSTGILWGTDTISCDISHHRMAFAATVKGTATTMEHCSTGSTLTIQGAGHHIGPNRQQGGSLVIDAAATGCTIIPNDAVVTDNSGGVNYIAGSSNTTITGSAVKLKEFTGLIQGKGATAIGAITDSSTVGQVLRVTGAATYAWGALNLADTDAVTGDLPLANLTQGSALSVLGVAGNATADNASIAAGADTNILRRNGTSIGFGSIDLSNSGAVGASTLQPANGGTGITALGAGVATFLGTPSSTNLAAAVTGETGTGALVFADTPSLTTPALGAATATSIAFGGGTALANYVEGTWTPVDSSGAALSFTGVSASYTRIGRMVFAYATLTYPVTADGTNALIGGLPITVANANYARQGFLSYYGQTPSPTTLTYFFPTINATTFALIGSTGNALTNAQLSGQVMYFTIVYPAS